jgi:hypothetical protein
MNSDEWLSTERALPMLEYLDGQASERKLRLFACACCRHDVVWRLLPRSARDLVDVAEQFSEGCEGWQRLTDVAAFAPMGRLTGAWRNPVRLSKSAQAHRAAQCLATRDAWEAAWGTYQHTQNLLGGAACDLLREIFGNPIIEEPRLDSMGSTVMALARAIYQERAFDRMPILADALDEAGCVDDDVVEHCHAASAHYRGCWVLDLLVRTESSLDATMPQNE